MMTVRVGQNNESGSKANQEINLRVDIAFLIRKQSQKWKKSGIIKGKMVMIKLYDINKITVKSVHIFHCVFSANVSALLFLYLINDISHLSHANSSQTQNAFVQANRLTKTCRKRSLARVGLENHIDFTYGHLQYNDNDS